jgi:hypothetical protein
LDRIEEVELAGVPLVVEMNRIVAAEAGVAKSLGPAVEKAVHALMTEIAGLSASMNLRISSTELAEALEQLVKNRPYLTAASAPIQ